MGGFRSSNVTSFLGMPSGPVQGLQSSNSNSFNAFLGIPYASAGRWETPEDPDAWSEPFQANQYGPMCPQANSSVAPVDELLFADQPWNHAMPPPAQQVQSEDCLRVNVYSPANASAAPVMVWIYGGGLMSGISGCQGCRRSHLQLQVGRPRIPCSSRLWRHQLWAVRPDQGLGVGPEEHCRIWWRP